MSCIAVLITQFNFPDFEAQTNLCSDSILSEIILTGPYRIGRKSLLMHVPVPDYSLDLNRLLSKPPLTADVGGRYFSSSAVLSHVMSPRTWLRSVIPHSLMAVSSSSLSTTPSLAYTHRSAKQIQLTIRTILHAFRVVHDRALEWSANTNTLCS
jgi:hypothetical protein